MTQKGNFFKGQQKKKSIPPNRHGKASRTRKGIGVFFPFDSMYGNVKGIPFASNFAQKVVKHENFLIFVTYSIMVPFLLQTRNAS